MNIRLIVPIILIFTLSLILIAHADYWDETSGVAFSQPLQSTHILTYNVTAIAQSDSDGIGPAYLLNGLSSAGYWYQIGISYNWPTQVNSSTGSLGHFSGFQVNYNIFDPNGTVIAPVCYSNACGGGANLSGPVYSGDKVLLSLNIVNNTVIMSVKDWNTGAAANISFSSYGAREFQGTLYPPNYAGFFTGLMTEWYHNHAYYYANGSSSYYEEQRTTYSPYGLMPDQGWLFLFKICDPSSCLNSNSNLGYFVANVKGQGSYITYTPKNSTELTQSNLPYNFSSYDGQADNFYKNGTFATGTLNPLITTTVSTSSTTSTSTISTVSTSASTSTSTTSIPSTMPTTIIPTTISNSINQINEVQKGSSDNGNLYGWVMIVVIIILTITAIVYYLVKTKAKG